MDLSGPSIDVKLKERKKEDTKPTPELEITTLFTKFGYISAIRNATIVGSHQLYLVLKTNFTRGKKNKNQ
jgi:hypothetical protein